MFVSGFPFTVIRNIAIRYLVFFIVVNDKHNASSCSHPCICWITRISNKPSANLSMELRIGFNGIETVSRVGLNTGEGNFEAC